MESLCTEDWKVGTLPPAFLLSILFHFIFPKLAGGRDVPTHPARTIIVKT